MKKSNYESKPYIEYMWRIIILGSVLQTTTNEKKIFVKKVLLIYLESRFTISFRAVNENT